MRLSTLSNIAYLAPALMLWPFASPEVVALAASLVGLTLGSGLYHIEGAEHGRLGHRWDEAAMLMVLFALAAYTWEVGRGGGVAVLFAAALCMPLLTVSIDDLPAWTYTVVLGAASLLGAYFAVGFMVLLPAGVFALAALVRGRDDNHWRHGLWHIGAAAALCVLLLLTNKP